MYRSVTNRQLVHMRKYTQGHDHLGLKETAVGVLFGSSFNLGWAESFGLYSELRGATDEFQSVWSVYSILWNDGSLNSRENG